MRRGRQPGRPTKWVFASLEQTVAVNTLGVKFDVWRKWKKRRRKLGTLVVSVGGLRWLPAGGRLQRRRDWDAVREWLSD
jgi:hypothetical protein